MSFSEEDILLLLSREEEITRDKLPFVLPTERSFIRIRILPIHYKYLRGTGTYLWHSEVVILSFVEAR